MPRSIQEILDHADELAKRFEDYEGRAPSPRTFSQWMATDPRFCRIEQGVYALRQEESDGIEA